MTRVVDPTYVPLTVTCPKGTTQAAPLFTTANVGHGILEEVELQIPAGHVGVTGVRFVLSGQQFLPWSNDPAWIVGDNFFRTFEVGVEVDTKLQVATFNLGNYDHQFLMRFKMRNIKTTVGFAPLTLVNNDTISSTG